MGYHRVLIYLYESLLLLLAFLKMGSRDTRLRVKHSKLYSFKPFHYEEVHALKGNKKAVMPLPRSGHRIVCDTKNLYSFGGYNPSVNRGEDGFFAEDRENDMNVHSFPLFKELWKFNFATRKWTIFTERESLPTVLASNAVIRHGNYLLVYGGTGAPFGYRCSNQLYVCSLTSVDNRMEEITTSGILPMPQYGQAILFHNDHLYTFGGTTGFSYTSDIHRLNLKCLSWEPVYICQGQGESEPKGRYRHEVAYDGQDMFILGGGTAEDVFDFIDIPVFNFDRNEWRLQKTIGDPRAIRTANNGIPPARRCHGMVQIEKNNAVHAFISAGYGGVEIFDDLWCLNLRTFQWTLIETCHLPYPTYFHSSAVTPEGKMYIFGGIYAADHTVRNNQIHSTWLHIPKLSEMCWEALLHYNPDLIKCGKSELINAGLPRNFVNRIEA